MATNNTKMATKNNVKGLLKGLKYISQIFEDEEPEMQIGAPTDVKHVAHIGMEGQSANASAPSWLSDFNSPANESEAIEEKPAKSVSQEKPEVGKSSKRNSSTNANGSSSKEKKDKDSRLRRSSSRRSSSTANGDCSLKDVRAHRSSQSISDMPDVLKTSKRDKPKTSKKSSSKNSTSSETSSKPKKVVKDPSQATEANSTSEDHTKKTDRRKKSKDVGLSKEKRTQDLDSGSGSET